MTTAASKTPPQRLSNTQWLTRWTFVWLGRFAAMYLVIVLVMMFLETWLVYLPNRERTTTPPPGLVYEDVTFPAEDGTKIHAWFIPHPEARVQILFAHGNAGDLTFRGSYMQHISRLFEADVMVFDYRGYGRSEGSPHEAGLYMDARAARDWLAQRTNIRPQDVVLWGRSLGGGVVMELAANDGARGVITECTFTSLPDVAAPLYPWLPVRWIMRNRFDSLSKIASYHGPLLLAHGEADELIPVSHARRLFEAANEPKELITLPGMMHNDPFYSPFPETVDAFLKRLPPLETSREPEEKQN
jgi:fermentation-respiration switch protein FrsA (DUF1100 family)